MSQAGSLGTGGGGGGSPINEIDTQNGNATPINNVIIMNGIDSTENNDNGIITKGGVAGTGVQNEVDIVITNRATGTATTTDNTPTPIITFALGGTPGTYYFSGNLQAFNSSTPASGGYSFTSAFRTDGVSCVEVGGAFDDQWEDIVLEDADMSFEPSGNNAVLSVEGVNGLTINWNALIEYRRVL